MSDAPSPEEEPKLVIDTDWKEQVAKEKEQVAKEKEQAETVEDIADTASHESDVTPAGDEAQLPPPPPASFEVLISLMFTQAIGALGQMPHPATGEVEVNKPFAKHYIDTLEMLGEKTKGNLTDDETKMLSEALHALRMMYVEARA